MMLVHNLPAELSPRNFILKLPEGENGGGKETRKAGLCLTRLHRGKDELGKVLTPARLSL